MIGTHWRCFFCDEVFHTKETAAEHFGSDDGCYSEGPACKLNELEGGLLKLYREALAELWHYRNDDSEVSKTLYKLGGDHAVTLRRAEEEGYAKGLKDGRELKE